VAIRLSCARGTLRPDFRQLLVVPEPSTADVLPPKRRGPRQRRGGPVAAQNQSAGPLPVQLSVSVMTHRRSPWRRPGSQASRSGAGEQNLRLPSRRRRRTPDAPFAATLGRIRRRKPPAPQEKTAISASEPCWSRISSKILPTGSRKPRRSLWFRRTLGPKRELRISHIETSPPTACDTRSSEMPAVMHILSATFFIPAGPISHGPPFLRRPSAPAILQAARAPSSGSRPGLDQPRRRFAGRTPS
jgi:hypothetical protein